MRTYTSSDCVERVRVKKRDIGKMEPLMYSRTLNPHLNLVDRKLFPCTYHKYHYSYTDIHVPVEILNFVNDRISLPIRSEMYLDHQLYGYKSGRFGTKDKG